MQVPEKWLQPSIVLLDVGMVTFLARQEQLLLTQMFKAFSSLDGSGMAHAALAFSGDKQTCPDPEVCTPPPRYAGVGTLVLCMLVLVTVYNCG